MKKMRRLIPAIAMLLVSAVMLSTASFAWFTMNDQVTASGMQIQAKSTGSLIISDAPLTNLSTKTSVDMAVPTAQTLKPITWNTDAWKTAPSTPGAVDPITGEIVTGDLAAVVGIDNVAGDYFIDKEVYIGSAGDAMPKQAITINLAAVAGDDEMASRAYAVAIYVIDRETQAAIWANDKYADYATKPDAVIYTDTMQEADADFTRNMVVLRGKATTTTVDGVETTTYAGYTIPSIIGVEGKDASGNDIVTGLKIVLRFFVDGDLDAITSTGSAATKAYANNKYITLGTSYVGADGVQATADTKFSATATYYKKVVTTEGEGEDAVEVTTWEVVNTANLTDAQKADLTTAPSYAADGGWYVNVNDYTFEEYKYVNSDEVPTTGTALSVTFSVATLGA